MLTELLRELRAKAPFIYLTSYEETAMPVHPPKPVDLSILPPLPKEVRGEVLITTVKMLTHLNRYGFSSAKITGTLPILESMQAGVNKHTQKLYANRQEAGKKVGKDVHVNLYRRVPPLSMYIILHKHTGVCNLLRGIVGGRITSPIIQSWPYGVGRSHTVPATLDDLDILVNAPDPESADYPEYIGATLPYLHNQAYLAYCDPTIDNWDTLTFYGEARLNLLRYCLHNIIDILREVDTYPHLKDT